MITAGDTERSVSVNQRLSMSGLNVAEAWNSVNGFIFYGKSGEIATNRLEDQEIAVFSLHLLQACLVYINTLIPTGFCRAAMAG